MKKGVILILIFCVAIAFAGAFLNDFKAHSDGENVILEWRTGEEDNVKEFVIERKTPQSTFVEIARIPAKGSNSYYTYKDLSAYKTTDLMFVYELGIVEKNQINPSTYSGEVSVLQNISGVKQTWGSIKAMFR